MTLPAKVLRTMMLLGAAVLLVYGAFLGYSPAYLTHDEMLFALQAHAVASGELHGTAMPLYFPILAGYWAQPIVVYFTALFLKVLPLSETSIRLPTAVLGAADVALMYLAARRLVRRDWIAIVAAGMLALTPAHFLLSRLAVDALYPLPFITAWLLCLLVFEQSGQPRTLVGGAVILGVGFYTYIGSVVMMPVYFALTCLVLFRRGAGGKLYALAGAGFLLPLVPFVVWLSQHPAAAAEFLGRYQLSSSIHGLRYHVLVERVSIYWSCFDPGFLFALAEDSPINTTFRAGVFLLPMAPLVAIGAWRMVTDANSSRVNVVLLLGLLCAPLGVAIVGERTIPRMLSIVPFAVLVAAVGLEHALDSPRGLRRMAVVTLLVLMPLQFAYFAFDYFTDYRRRSGGWMEHNRRDALTDVMARVAPAAGRRIYLAGDIPWIEQYWRFFTIANGREDLRDRASTFDPLAAWTMPTGSVVLTTFDPARHDARAAAAGARQAVTISDPDGTLWFSVFER